jgi:hypothetical protein
LNALLSVAYYDAQADLLLMGDTLYPSVFASPAFRKI